MEDSMQTTKSVHSAHPLVSVILATCNEARSIDACLESILSQHTTCPRTGGFDIEVLAVDGLSHDGTLETLDHCAAMDQRLRVIPNERQRTPFAFNLGLQHARGEFVCILGAHSLYRRDYIATCLDELLAHEAAACGGRVLTVPADNTLGARLCAWTMSHPFGSSGKSFRTQPEGPVDTVNYPVMRRDLALSVGGYDEDMLRNQDNDLNQKLRSAGHILWCTWKTHCLYFPKRSVRHLLRYAYTNGYWNALSLRKNAASMSIRHFVPFLFVLCLLAGILLAASGAWWAALHPLLAFIPLLALLCAHIFLGTVAALQLSVRERTLDPLWLPPVLLGFHIAYGAGTLSGLVHQVRNALRSRHQAPQRPVRSAG
jgi:glycosyltransferase involved in cell wall biosynthesis